MSKREKKEESGGGDANAWMVTFSDLLMLMLTFFVLLLTMASMDDKDLDEIRRPGLNTDQADDVGSSLPRNIDDIMEPSFSEAMRAVAQDLEAGVEHPDIDMLEEIFLDESIRGRAWLRRLPGAIAIELDGTVAFEGGSDRLTPGSISFLRLLGTTFRDLGLQVSVDAFVSQTRGAAQSEEDWDLALRRADRAVRLLSTSMPAERLRMMGVGYPAGRDEGAFSRNADLLRVSILTNEPRARAGTI